MVCDSIMICIQSPHQVTKRGLSLLMVRYPVQILHRGSQILMAELLSQFVDWQAIFQLVGSIGMAQTMDAAYLFNASFVFGLSECLLCCCRRQVLNRPAGIGKKPEKGPIYHPVIAQVIE